MIFAVERKWAILYWVFILYFHHFLFFFIFFPSQIVPMFASTYVLVAMSLDRLDAVVRPMNFSAGNRTNEQLWSDL